LLVQEGGGTARIFLVFSLTAHRKQKRTAYAIRFIFGGDRGASAAWNLNRAEQARQQTAFRSRWSLHIGGFLLRMQFAHDFSSKQSPPKTKQSR
jgi:hypothetical protein